MGAGPGDAKLLTLRGLQVIQQAEVVLYDSLVSADILELVRRMMLIEFVWVKERGNTVRCKKKSIN